MTESRAIQQARDILADPSTTAAQRVVLAYLALSDGEPSYREIQAATGISHQVIAAARRFREGSARDGSEPRKSRPVQQKRRSASEREALPRGKRSASEREAPQPAPKDPDTTAEARRQQQARALAAFYRETVRPGDDTCTPKGRAAKNALKLLRDGVPYTDLQAAVLNYAATCAARGRDAQYRKAGGNFFGQDATFDAYLPANYQPKSAPGSTNTATADPEADEWEQMLQRASKEPS